MNSVVDRILARLRADWPDWQVWVVYRAVGGPVWCAQRWDGTGNTINADRPEHLVQYLEEEAGR